jgi:hypothetical protein
MFRTFSSISILMCLSLAGFFNYGCAGIFENPDLKNIAEEGSYATRIFNAPYHQVFKAVEKAIIHKEYPIKMCDERGGIIDSNYRLHDGNFTLGFVGAKLRSRMIARLAEKGPKQVEVTLMILAEKEDDIGTWLDFPISSFNLDLIDSDSYDMFFYYISENLRDPLLSGT